MSAITARHNETSWPEVVVLGSPFFRVGRWPSSPDLPIIKTHEPWHGDFRRLNALQQALFRLRHFANPFWQHERHRSNWEVLTSGISQNSPQLRRSLGIGCFVRSTPAPPKACRERWRLPFPRSCRGAPPRCASGDQEDWPRSTRSWCPRGTTHEVRMHATLAYLASNLAD